ncbi:hypothetical protein FDH86_gp102 [Arthrobacter phage Tank]|uniref:Uncharacterized protein n=2 Tax=Tankvirus tank TaxID=1982567 RepID=A0A0U4B7A8_9CAUD|nr:hypothetical protein FDH86_gp102 [Arthrobacter phage Tank]ALY10637.1 hypothetical protein TANK_102 [Arthrobacter phage Tank]ALY10886.1 hypothetical protein WILDE_105 [Arthrobacter phage Wilde]
MPLTPGKSPAKVAAEAANHHPLAAFAYISEALTDAVDALDAGKTESALHYVKEARQRSDEERDKLTS